MKIYYNGAELVEEKSAQALLDKIEDKQVKKCKKCQEYKTLHHFTIRSASKDGLHHQCKACKNNTQNRSREIARSEV